MPGWMWPDSSTRLELAANRTVADLERQCHELLDAAYAAAESDMSTRLAHMGWPKRSWRAG